jgi:hypothetical protein
MKSIIIGIAGGTGSNLHEVAARDVCHDVFSILFRSSVFGTSSFAAH